MPSVPTTATVLVTGASGFLGSYVVESLLTKGFDVLGTVRNDKRGRELSEILGYHSHFRYLVVPDIGVAGAFDEAVEGVDAVIHTASPVTLTSNDPKAVIDPAIAGTIGILNSAKRFGPNVERITIISSTIAVGGNTVQGNYTFTDKDWNDPIVKYVEENGNSSDPFAIYGASKVLAERAAWEFLGANRDSISFDITTVCPPWIFGPMLNNQGPPKDSSNEYFFSGLRPERTGDAATQQEGALVDVRDLANILAELLTRDKAGNERILTSAVEFSWQDVYDALNANPAIPGAPIGSPGATTGNDYAKKYDKTKLQSILGLESDKIFRPLSETVRDLVKQVKANGVW